MTRRGTGCVDRWPREKQRGRAHRAPGVMSGRRSVMVLVMVLALAHALANIGLCARGVALDDATRCGDAIVRKVSRIGPRGIEILIESTEEVEVSVNGACKVSNVEVKRHGICVAVAPHQLTNAIEFVRALDFKRDRVEVQVWYATLPPRLLVDTTSNKRHALKLLDLELASDESFGESKVVHTSAIIRILDAFTHGDEAWEESQDAKSFVVIGGPTLEPDESNRVLELPRSGSACMYRLDTPKNVRTIVEEIQQRKFHRASCCTSVSRSIFALSINGTVCRVRSPSLDTIRHLPVSTNCTAEKYTEEIILQFTPEERKSFESRRSFLRGSFEDMIVAKQKFSLSLRFDGGPPIPAEGRFRGVSSFRDCERRKSLAVSVKNGPLRLMPGTVTDQFLLISLCYDDRYVKTFLVFHMAKELGLFPLSFRFVRLKVASGSTLEEEGLYLLVDDPKAALRRQHVALTDVVRRRFDPARGTMDPKSEPDVSAYPKSFRNSLAARVRYERIVLASENCSDVGTACFDQLDELLDVDGYLRWLALMTWVQSGDYVDEVWFYASETSNGRHRHQLLIWDPDDSFESCHHGGVDAIGDSDLLYCAEGAIDKVLFRSEHMWSRYIENLNLVLRELPKRRLREIVSLEENQIRKLLSEDKNSYSGLLELLRIVPSIDSSKKAISEIIGSLRYYETLINFRRRSLLRHPVAYAWNGTDAWTPAPPLDVCDEKAAQVETQVRSYDLPNQEILIRVRAERAYALNLTFSPTVVYNGSTYNAIRDEFVLESWSEDVHLTPTNALSAAKTESECDRTFIGGGYLVLVCNATNHQRLFSLHHRFWHSLANTSERMMNIDFSTLPSSPTSPCLVLYE